MTSQTLSGRPLSLQRGLRLLRRVLEDLLNVYVHLTGH
jgi:hypothetical protein